MPCMMTADEITWCNQEAAARQSKESIDRFGIDMTDPHVATRIACEACKLIYRHDLQFEAGSELHRWYAAHQVLDQEREGKEREEAARQEQETLRNHLREQLARPDLRVEELRRMAQALYGDGNSS